MPKILLISNTAWSFITYREHVVRHLIDRGFSVICVSGNHEPADADAIIRLKEMGAEFMPINLSRSGIHPIHEIKSFIEIYRLARHIRPDLTLAYTIKPVTYAGLCCSLLRLPIISVLTGFGYVFTQKSIRAIISRIVISIGLFFQKQIWALNTDDYKILVQMPLIPKKNIFLLPGEGIDQHRFPMLPFKESGPFTFLVIARILTEKGLREFCHAASRIQSEYKETRFEVVGPMDPDNPGALSKEEWDHLIKSSGVIYHGPQKDIRPYMSACDFFVLPSYREGLPTVLLEAGLMAKPSIATDVQGCRDVITDGMNGYMIRPRDGNDLYRACRKAILMPQPQRMEMGKMARQNVLTRFEKDVILKMYDQQIDQILSAS